MKCYPSHNLPIKVKALGERPYLNYSKKIGIDNANQSLNEPTEASNKSRLWSKGKWRQDLILIRELPIPKHHLNY